MTPQYAAYLAPVRATNQIYRLVLGVMLIAGIYAAWMTGIAGASWLITGFDGFGHQLERIGRGTDPWSLILLLSTFAGAWIGTSMTLRLFHRRRLRSLFGRPAIVLRDFALGAGMMLGFGGGLALVVLPMLPGLTLATEPEVWLAFLPLALVGVLVQTGAEELVFRGYIQGQLASRFKPALVWLGAPTLLFGFAHYSPEMQGVNTWLIVASTGLFGLIASDLTAQTGSLGLGWGLHFSNNVLAILVVSVSGGLDGLALMHVQDTTAAGNLLRPLIFSDMVLMILVWIACRLWLRRR